MRRTLTLLAASFLALAGRRALAAEDAAAAATTTATAHVTYVSGSSIYLDAGSAEGLAVGDTIELVRDDAVVAKLTVTYVTTHKATASPAGPAPEITIGDTLRFAPRSPAGAPAAGPPAAAAGAAAATGAASGSTAIIPASTGGTAATSASSTRSGESAFRRAGMRGRLGVRYLWVKDNTGFGQDISQPSLDLFLQGNQIGGAPVDLYVDARARHTYVTPASGASRNYGVDHIYQANVAYRPGDFRLVFGRIVSPTLAVVSLYDGMVAEYRHAGWTAGLLAGTQPNPDTYAFSSDVRQYGAYGAWASDPKRVTRWGVGFGAISSSENGQINRDFTYVEARVTHPVVSVYLQQQVDINRGWRKEAEGTDFTPSATFVMIHVRPADAWTIDGGYDSRRNVLLYPDYVTPVTTFDDATRQGYWLGAAWRPGGHWLVGIDARRSTGGTAGTATSYTARFGALGMTKQQIDVELRGTSYDGPSLNGYLVALTGSIALGSRVRLDLHGGTRQDTGLFTASTTEMIDWYGTLLDVYIGRSMYFNLSYDRTTGGDEDNDQAYGAFSWRF